MSQLIPILHLLRKPYPDGPPMNLFHFPQTIVFKNGVLSEWLFSSVKTGLILKKRKENMDKASIVPTLTKNIPSHGIIAVFSGSISSSEKTKKSPYLPFYKTLFLDEENLTFLMKYWIVLHGTISTFVTPYSRNNSTISCNWTPSFTLFSETVNTHEIDNTAFEMQLRAITTEQKSEHSQTHSFQNALVVRTLTGIVHQIQNHLNAVNPSGKILTKCTYYFRIGEERKIYLIDVQQAQFQNKQEQTMSPMKSPSRHDNPMSKSVTKMRSSHPKTETTLPPLNGDNSQKNLQKSSNDDPPTIRVRSMSMQTLSTRPRRSSSKNGTSQNEDRDSQKSDGNDSSQKELKQDTKQAQSKSPRQGRTSVGKSQKPKQRSTSSHGSISSTQNRSEGVSTRLYNPPDRSKREEEEKKKKHEAEVKERKMIKKFLSTRSIYTLEGSISPKKRFHNQNRDRSHHKHGNRPEKQRESPKKQNTNEIQSYGEPDIMEYERKTFTPMRSRNAARRKEIEGIEEAFEDVSGAEEEGEKNDDGGRKDETQRINKSNEASESDHVSCHDQPSKSDPETQPTNKDRPQQTQNNQPQQKEDESEDADDNYEDDFGDDFESDESEKQAETDEGIPHDPPKAEPEEMSQTEDERQEDSDHSDRDPSQPKNRSFAQPARKTSQNLTEDRNEDDEMNNGPIESENEVGSIAPSISVSDEGSQDDNSGWEHRNADKKAESPEQQQNQPSRFKFGMDDDEDDDEDDYSDFG
ncbi:hypothetical protein BLNAU_3889 [Blattamonas nauphoetae]|uniref:Uncharacterized protein n=1 Tax=Blattamonas nauphoetae TaxID=2049346 RepID=A0ABQ9YBG9_9EUKA|nr:hypothetical protein BLNAU_3889 [Blattamonas nauphoetae]